MVSPDAIICPFDGSKPILTYDENHANPEEIRKYFTEKHSFLYVMAEDRNRYSQALTNIVMQAKKHEINIHFADDLEPILEIERNNPEMTKHFMKALEHDYYIQKYTEEHLTPEEQSEFLIYLKKRNEARDAINPGLASFIKEKAVNADGEAEKAIVLYGYGHSYATRDLDEFLGEKQTATVAIYSSPQFHDTPIGQILSEETTDRDHYAFYINNGDAVKVRNIPLHGSGLIKWLKELWKMPSKSSQATTGHIEMGNSQEDTTSVNTEKMGQLSPCPQGKYCASTKNSGRY